MTVRIAVAGAGAFGNKHLDALATIEDAEVIAVVDPVEAAALKVADARGIADAVTELDDVLGRDDVDAVILATPTPMHAAQAIACLEAGKHVEVEIPLCDNLADGRAVVEAQARSGKVAACGHTRRFNPSHQWIHDKIKAGELNIQQMDVQTYFFRRTNTNALGQPRSWTDICSGTTPATPWICSNTRPASRPARCRPSRVPSNRNWVSPWICPSV